MKGRAFAPLALAALALACGVKAPPGPPLREAAADAGAGPNEPRSPAVSPPGGETVPALGTAAGAARPIPSLCPLPLEGEKR